MRARTCPYGHGRVDQSDRQRCGCGGPASNLPAAVRAGSPGPQARRISSAQTAIFDEVPCATSGGGSSAPRPERGDPCLAALRQAGPPGAAEKAARGLSAAGAALACRGMRVVLLGATERMGRALARRMAERGDQLFLLGRESGGAAAQRGRPRGPSPAARAGRRRTRATWRPRRASRRRSTQQRRLSAGSTPSVVTAGLFATQEAMEADTALAEQVLAVDFTGTVIFCEHARKRAAGARRRDAVRVLVGGGRARAQAGGAVRGGQGRAVALPRGLDPQVPRAGLEDGVRQAGVRERRG